MNQGDQREAANNEAAMKDAAEDLAHQVYGLLTSIQLSCASFDAAMKTIQDMHGPLPIQVPSLVPTATPEVGHPRPALALSPNPDEQNHHELGNVAPGNGDTFAFTPPQPSRVLRQPSTQYPFPHFPSNDFETPPRQQQQQQQQQQQLPMAAPPPREPIFRWTSNVSTASTAADIPQANDNAQLDNNTNNDNNNNNGDWTQPSPASQTNTSRDGGVQRVQRTNSGDEPHSDGGSMAGRSPSNGHDR